MLPIQDSEKAKWQSGQYHKELKLEFPAINLTILNDEIYGESMTLQEGLFDGNGALEISGCISSKFTVEIRHNSNISPYYYVIASIRVDNEPWMPIFHGIVNSIETIRNRSYQKLECYDVIQYFSDVNVVGAYNNLGDTFTVKQLRDAIFSYIEVTQKSQVLPNDNVVLHKRSLTEFATIDAVKAICQMNGMFGIINRDGHFEYRTLAQTDGEALYPSNSLFPSSNLFPGIQSGSQGEQISSYNTIKYEIYDVMPITKVTVRDSSSDAQSGSWGTNGNNYLIEGNMFLSGELQAVKESIATGVMSVIGDITYKPFDLNILGLPYIEVGDAVAVDVYDYSDSEHPLAITMTFNVLTRNLKGIQWLRDNYMASGAEEQPEIKWTITGGSNGGGVDRAEIDNIKTDIDDMNDEIDLAKDDIDDLKDSKQDTLTAGTGISIASNTISVTNPIVLSTEDLTPNVSQLATGTIYLVYE